MKKLMLARMIAFYFTRKITTRQRVIYEMELRPYVSIKTLDSDTK